MKSAFLHGSMEGTDSVYMRPLQGVHCGLQKGKAFRLNKSIYGLKQSNSIWGRLLTSRLIDIGFWPLQSDECFFMRNTGQVTIRIVVYVDDMLLIGDDRSTMEDVKAKLAQSFKMKTENATTSFLGVHMDRKNESCILRQHKFILQLERFNMLESKAVSTPMSSTLKPGELLRGDPITFTVLYQEAIGALLYLAGRTRPDESFAVKVLAHTQGRPTMNHLKAVKRVLRYLNGTRNTGLEIKPADAGRHQSTSNSLC